MNSDEDVFRFLLLASFAILMPFATYHRIRSFTGEKLDRIHEGLFTLVAVRLSGLISIIGLIMYVIDPRSMAWSSVVLPSWIRWSGIGLGVIAGVLVLWTMHSLGKNLTDTVVTRKLHTMVSGGPYRLVRHPFYVSVTLSLFANALAAANWFLLVTGLLFSGLIATRTRTEERFLVERFGVEYRNYMDRTGRFFPKFRNW